ncbi:uncharacterized protein LOC143738202 isoform X1 [Siphateles boraxobius]|uniref:uncharacterized protein LOC143738202 isoform X1 n=1 Tax=Siphateles boraxobius TaxID=180520 RepID=UPI0040630A6B
MSKFYYVQVVDLLLLLFCFIKYSDEISVKKGENLKLDVVLINADKVERNSRSGWTEVWRRGHGVSSDRLIISDQTLIIHDFTVTDTGTYRVLDSNNEALITVTVTESVLDSKGNLNDTDKDKTDDTEHRNHWILPVGLTVGLVLVQMVLVVLVVLAAVGIHRLRQRLLAG